MKTNKKMAILCSALLLSAVVEVNAEVVLPNHLTDNMVLQQQTEVKLYGQAKKGKKVVVKADWSKEVWTTKADAEGNWEVKVQTPKAGGPYTLSFNDGKTLKLNNVLVGEVWFCSGQSNMEMPVEGWGKIKNYQEEVKNANYPNIRLFQVKKATSTQPEESMESTMGGWVECAPETVHNFSALAYLYARDLQQSLKVPVGVIDCSWGGTPAESWTSGVSIEKVMGYQEQLRQMREVGYKPEKVQQIYEKQMDAWRAQMDGIDKGEALAHRFALTAGADAKGWSSMELPGYFDTKELPGFDGIVWYARTVEIPQEWEGKELALNLGNIDDEDIVYWNNEKIAQGSGYNQPRHYTVPAKVVKSGKNTLVVKVTDTGGEGGFGGMEPMNLKKGTRTLALNGVWNYVVGCSTRDMPQAPMSPGHSSFPTVLFNAMVHPWVNFAIKGVIWYQGCANVGRGEQYESLFQTLINDWRMQWNQPEMPFYFVQLANYLQRKEVQSDSEWAALREAQAEALRLEHTGMVTIIDIGEAGDIHPKDKQEVARRMSLLSLADTYGKKVAGTAPVYQCYTVDGEGRAHVRFALPKIGEKLTPNKEIHGFTVAGPDQVFYPAKAWMQGEKVVVSCDQVKFPVAVRYGWADNPDCNLHTPSGFAVSPFRSDNW